MIVENGSSMPSLESSLDRIPCTFIIHINFLASSFQISFNHVAWAAIVWPTLANEGVDRVVTLDCHILLFVCWLGILLLCVRPLLFLLRCSMFVPFCINKISLLLLMKINKLVNK